MKHLVFIAPGTPTETILAAGMLALLAEKNSPELVTVVCPAVLARFYKNAPFPCKTLDIDPGRDSVLERLAAKPRPELCVNARTHRDAVSDTLALGSRADEVVGHKPAPGEITAGTSRPADGRYTRLAPGATAKKLESQRHRDLLKVLGIEVDRVNPAIWTSPADSAWAQAFLRDNKLSPGHTLILFPEHPHPSAAWTGFPEALVSLCRRDGLAIVAIGETAGEQGTRQLDAMTAAGVKVFDQRAKADYFQAAELMRSARAAIGLENTFAHIACAVGCRNVVLLAGGEFGRWMPYSPLTSGIALPLHCLGCGWRCRFESPYCTTAAAPFMLQIALHETLTRREASEFPRIFVQHADFALTGLSDAGKIPAADCFLNPDALAPLLYDVFLVTPPRLTAIGTPPSLYGCTLRVVRVHQRPARPAP